MTYCVVVAAEQVDHTTCLAGLSLFQLRNLLWQSQTLPKLKCAIQNKLEMWANAQRDGRPTEHTSRPLFNAAKFG